MKSIIVVCKDEEACRQIEATFQTGCNVERTQEKNGALEMLQKRRFDLLFIDLNALNNAVADNNYRELLLPFWRIYPSVEIIVMAPQNMIRNAVQAVKAGANDYLTYPLDAAEIKLVSETINKTKILQSELGLPEGSILAGRLIRDFTDQQRSNEKSFPATSLGFSHEEHGTAHG